jgi:hypothetical protein
VGDALAAEVNVLVGEVAGGIGFVEDFGACAVPIDFAAGFLEAVTVAIVSVSDTTGGFDLALGVPSVGVVSVVEGVAGSVVAEGGDLVVAIGDEAEAALDLAAVVGRGRDVDVCEVDCWRRSSMLLARS